MAQLVMILGLTIKINRQRNYVLGSTTLKKYEDLDYDKDLPLKYFYSFPPNSSKAFASDWQKEDIVNKINRDGLNDRYDYPLNKDSHAYRIVTLGDSFTFGQYVETENNWTELLEVNLNEKPICKNKKYEIINLGMPGYDIQYEVEAFRLKGVKYKPDLVIWMMVDPNRLNEKMLPVINNCINDDKTRDNPSEYQCWRKARDKVFDKYGKANVTKYLIDSFDRFFDFYGKGTVIVNLDYTHNNILTNRKNVRIMDLSYFANGSLQLPDGHPNYKGHQYFASEIYDYLVNNQIINCE